MRNQVHLVDPSAMPVGHNFLIRNFDDGTRVAYVTEDALRPEKLCSLFAAFAASRETTSEA